MERREFLIRAGWALVATPAVLNFAACGGGGTGTSTGTPSPAATGDFTVTSTVAFGHTHDITVKAADLAAGLKVTYTSTVAGATPHTHTVTLTPAVITDINGGKSDTVNNDPDTTSHGHDWVIKKP